MRRWLQTMVLFYICGPDSRLQEISSYHRNQIQYAMPYLQYSTKKKRKNYKTVGVKKSQVNLKTA